MTTIDTITDKQIEQLYDEAVAAADFDMSVICLRALGINSCLPDGSTIAEARAECARIISEAEAQRDEQ